MRIQTFKNMKRRKEIWPRLWMALLLWVLLGRAVVMPSFAAEVPLWGHYWKHPTTLPQTCGMKTRASPIMGWGSFNTNGEEEII